MARRVTDANLYHEHSSRSHALLSLYLEKKTARADVERTLVGVE